MMTWNMFQTTMKLTTISTNITKNLQKLHYKVLKKGNIHEELIKNNININDKAANFANLIYVKILSQQIFFKTRIRKMLVINTL